MISLFIGLFYGQYTLQANMASNSSDNGEIQDEARELVGAVDNRYNIIIVVVIIKFNRRSIFIS